MGKDALKNAAEHFKNKDSFFKKNILPMLKVLNVIALCILGIVSITSFNESNLFKINSLLIVIVFGLSPLIATVIEATIISNHKFYEWDKKEREKRGTFLTSLTLMVFFFTYLSVFSISTAIYDLKNTDLGALDRPDIIVIIIRLLFGIISLVNAIFSVQLHYGWYSSSLTLDEYSLAKKPDNWDWERTSADDIADAFGR